MSNMFGGSLFSGAATAAVEAVETVPTPDQWQIAKNGKNFVKLPGVKGWSAIVWRQGDETVADAIERKRNEPAGKTDRPPRSRKARKMEDRPAVDSETSKDEVTRQIQEMMADILCAPAMPCAGFGLQWEADHFATQGDRFASNIAKASERNPWLRKKLESGLQGEQTVIAWLTSLNLVTGAVGYVLPPLIKWSILPVPDTVRHMFGVPGSQPVTVTRQPYQPPITDAVQNMAAMWAQAEQAAQAAEPPMTVAQDGAPADDGVS